MAHYQLHQQHREVKHLAHVGVTFIVGRDQAKTNFQAMASQWSHCLAAAAAAAQMTTCSLPPEVHMSIQNGAIRLAQ